MSDHYTMWKRITNGKSSLEKHVEHDPKLASAMLFPCPTMRMPMNIFTLTNIYDPRSPNPQYPPRFFVLQTTRSFITLNLHFSTRDLHIQPFGDLFLKEDHRFFYPNKHTNFHSLKQARIAQTSLAASNCHSHQICISISTQRPLDASLTIILNKRQM